MSPQDRIAAEISRQKKALDELPKQFEFPLFNSKHALESQRRSGYRNSASAAREIADNSIESGATRVDIVFEQPNQTGEKYRKDNVSAVAFIDNGSGMLPEMARYALTWGAGTHFDEPGTIGKFGFGLPNASINQTTRVEVYTKTLDDQTIKMAFLDVSQVKAHGLQSIEEPLEAEFPHFVQDYMQRNELEFEHGTVVVWQRPARLSYRLASNLNEPLLDDFGVVYRYLLGDVDIIVQGTRVEPVDPLFLTPGARLYEPEDNGGAIKSYETSIPVKFHRNPETGALHLVKAEEISEVDREDSDLLSVGAIEIKISRFPPHFSEHAGKNKKAISDPQKRFEIRKSRRGMSFVRVGREIETVDAFPRSARDESSGLGKWPLLQGYAYHWGIEVRFGSELDEAFGISNDKQTVRPVEDFWRLLHKEEIDLMLHAENNYQAKIRKKELPKPTSSDEPTAGEKASALTDSVTGKGLQVPERDREQTRQKLEDAAKHRSGVTNETIEKAREALRLEAKKRPYKIDYYEDPNGPFYEPDWEHEWTVITRINRAHPFFHTLYGPLMDITNAGQARHALDVLLIGLSKAELNADDELTKLWYEEQRKSVWSPFLATAMKVLAQTLHPQGLEEEDIIDQSDDEHMP